MKKQSNIYLLAVFILVFSVYSTYSEFKVIAKKGTISLKNSKNEWTELKYNDKLADDAVIKVGTKSFVLLYLENKKTFEINKAGTHDLKSISERVNQSMELSNSCLDFMLARFTRGKSLIQEDVSKKPKTAHGLVERSVVLDCIPKSKPPIGSQSERQHLFLNYPKTSYIIEQETEFNWTPIPMVNEYTFRLTDANGKVLLKQTVKENKLILKLNDLDVKPGNCYFWEIITCDETSDSYCISFMSERDLKKLKDNADKIVMENQELSKAAQQFILGSFFAEKNLVSEAKKHFSESIKLEPMADGFKAIYSSYLMEQGYIDEASMYSK